MSKKIKEPSSIPCNIPVYVDRHNCQKGLTGTEHLVETFSKETSNSESDFPLSKQKFSSIEMTQSTSDLEQVDLLETVTPKQDRLELHTDYAERIPGLPDLEPSDIAEIQGKTSGSSLAENVIQHNYGWDHTIDNVDINSTPHKLLSDEVDYLPSYIDVTSKPMPSAPPLSPEQNISHPDVVSNIFISEKDDKPTLEANIHSTGSKHKSISLKVNLLRASKRLVQFLKKVDLVGDLYEGKKVMAAIYRYEHIWLPLIAYNAVDTTIAPPLDVHWIWVVHMLAPQYYIQDCLKIVGRVIPHRLMTNKSLEKSMELGRIIWEKYYPSEPWDLTSEILSNPVYSASSSISYGLVEAIKRQSAFYYQVSLEHYKCKPFLYKAVLRYKQFLTLKKANPNIFLVPCYDIDIAWHAHQVHPLIYKADTEKILGDLLPHDDSVNDRSIGSKLSTSDNVTRDLWLKTFGTTFRREGSMFRGDTPATYLSEFPASVERLAHMSIFYVQITKIKINGNLSNGPLQVKLKREGEKLADFTLVHFQEDMPLLDITEMNLNFTVPEHVVNQWVVLKLSSKKTFGKILKILGKGSFWCMTNLSELFTIDDEGSISKFFLDEDSASTVELELSVKRERTANWVPIGIMTGEFMPHILEPQELLSHFGMVTGSKSDNDDIYLSEMATHRLLNESSISKPQLMEVEVCHSRHFMFSSIKIYADGPNKGRSLVCMSHTLDLNTIPSLMELKYNIGAYLSPSVTTLNAQSGERLMVIKSKGKDWALISGRWEGLRRGVKGSFSARGVPGSPGNLVVKLYQPIGAQPYTIILPYDKQIYSFQLPSLLIDMENGMLKVGRDSPEFVEQVTLGLSITVLHVLCQPRPQEFGMDTVDCESEPAVISYEAPKRIPTERLKFLAALGFFCASAPTNAYVCQKSKYSKEVPEKECVGGGFYYPLFAFPMITTDVGSCGGCGGCGGGVFETLPTPSSTLWGTSHSAANSSGGENGPDWGGNDGGDTGWSIGGDNKNSFLDTLFESGGDGDGGGDGGGCGACGGCGG